MNVNLAWATDQVLVPQSYAVIPCWELDQYKFFSQALMKEQKEPSSVSLFIGRLGKVQGDWGKGLTGIKV